MDWTEVRINWTAVRAKAHGKWNRLTDTDLATIAGKREQLVAKLEERYRLANDRAQKEADAFAKSLE